MKITVCELNNEPDDFARNWEMLVSHVKVEKSDLVLLPEMPFYPWFAWRKEFDSSVWEEAVDAHEKWEDRLHELAPATILGTRPINQDSKRLNQAFIWEEEAELQAARSKYYLPNEEGFWEASWYDKGDRDFVPIQTDKALIGFAICTEIWFFEYSRAYGKKGVHIIACPRATPKSTLDKWLVAGRAAAVVSGAFCISSNRINLSGKGADLGGQGWIVGPDGDVLDQTTQKKPFVTVEIDLNQAEKAKRTYPRYVIE
ncbi:MAG: carbon-nitrogen hydrolase family protein [Candidatus Aminicenantes bacterium]|jgi:N-carbamoylputrescine amidase